MTQADLLSLFAKHRSLLSLSASRAFLEALDSSLDIMQLYQELFPTDFLQTQAQELQLFPSNGQSYSPCEVQFFDLVNRFLFPLPLDYWLDGLDDPFGERRLAYEIPVDSMGFDLEQDDYESLSLGWQLLLYLAGVLDEEFLRKQEIIEDDAFFALPVAWGDVERALLTTRCEAQGGPIASFHLALQMLINDTGSLYLDVTVDDPADGYGWRKEDVEKLHAHYLLAKDILKKATSFCDWLEEEPLPRFAAVVRLWNACVRDSTPRDKRPKMMQVSASAFIEGLDFGTLFGRYIVLPTQS